MTTFLQRFFFPKTAALLDREAEIAHQREINAKLVDAICRGRGESPAFAPPDPPSPPMRTRIGPDAEADDFYASAIADEDARLVREAVSSDEGYAALWQMADEGIPRTAELLEDAERQIEERQARATVVEGTEAIQ